MDEKLHIVIDTETKERLKKKAESKGLNMSAYIRMVLIKSLKED